MVSLDLGCGECKREGFVGIDIVGYDSVNIVHDLNTGIPFEANSVDCIHMSHCLEHLEDVDFMLKEFRRVLKPQGRLDLFIPYFMCGCNFQHKHFFDGTIFRYLPKYGFNIHRKKLFFSVYNMRFMKPLGIIFDYIANHHFNFYTRYLKGFFYPLEIQITAIAEIKNPNLVK